VFTVYVVGAVARPGSYRATALTKVSELILRAAPLASASTRRLEIRRKTRNAPIIADMVRFSVLGDPSADPTVLDGDTVFVPLREFEVEAAGAVRRPGRYELVDKRNGAELLELAGGASSDAALGLPLRITTRVQDDRVEARSVPNLEAAATTQLRAGDVLRVPTLADLHRTVTVEGAVQLGSALPESEPVAAAGLRVPDAALPARPATSAQVPFVDGETVRDAIAKVGGLQPWADGKLSYLIRVGADGARQRVPVDVLAAGMRGGADTPLQSGDTLVIPSRRDAVVVGGAVYHPGVYAYSRELKPLDYLTLAGGATRNGRPNSAQVLRRTGQSMRIGDVSEIEPGDVISVPEATVSTAEWINFAIIVANLAVGTTALVLTVTHR
jgi:protein involved in polysaccharide export with SLBB domain